jgi:hypothetical protein
MSLNLAYLSLTPKLKSKSEAPLFRRPPIDRHTSNITIASGTEDGLPKRPLSEVLMIIFQRQAGLAQCLLLKGSRDAYCSFNGCCAS